MTLGVVIVLLGCSSVHCGSGRTGEAAIFGNISYSECRQAISPRLSLSLTLGFLGAFPDLLSNPAVLWLVGCQKRT